MMNEADVSSSPAMLLLRHGQTSWNARRRYLGWTDQPLSAEGVSGLKPVRTYLQSRRLAGTYCSDLLRTRQTLATLELAQAGDIRYDSRLRELNFGAWEGLTYNELQDNPLYCQWLSDPTTMVPPGGESLAAFRGRIEAWLAEASLSRASDEPLLVVAHGGSIRMIISLLNPGRSFWDTEVPAGSLIAWSPSTHSVTRIL